MRETFHTPPKTGQTDKLMRSSPSSLTKETLRAADDADRLVYLLQQAKKEISSLKHENRKLVSNWEEKLTNQFSDFQAIVRSKNQEIETLKNSREDLAESASENQTRRKGMLSMLSFILQ